MSPTSKKKKKKIERLTTWDHEPLLLVNVKPAIKAFRQTPQWLQDINQCCLNYGL
jgi:hypothetical protein